MRYGEINQFPIEIKSWYYEDDISGVDQPKKEDLKNTCELLNLPFTKAIAMAIIYGDSRMQTDRILPYWFNELE